VAYQVLSNAWFGVNKAFKNLKKHFVARIAEKAVFHSYLAFARKE